MTGPPYPAARRVRKPSNRSLLGRPAGSYRQPQRQPDVHRCPALASTSSQPRSMATRSERSTNSPYSYGNPYEANQHRAELRRGEPVRSGVSPVPHPQAALALVLGILGTVLGLSCIIGGLGGYRRDRRRPPGQERDRRGAGTLHRPAQAVAGFITGIVGVSISVLATVFIVLAISSPASRARTN